MQITNDTPVAMLTVGQLKEVLSAEVLSAISSQSRTNTGEKKESKGYVHGIGGIAQLFGCSMVTASRIKASGKIDGAITQIGRKIIVDAERALELAGRKTGGRRK